MKLKHIVAVVAGTRPEVIKMAPVYAALARSAPLRSWINGPLRPALLEYLGEASLRRRGIFEPRTVTALIEANARGQTDASYTLYTMLAVEIWCRKFVDSQG